MKSLDFVIVGFGIAGATIARELVHRGHRILVIDSNVHKATAIAGGTIHPAVLRYYNQVWRADEFWPKAKTFYQNWEQELEIPLITTKGLIRVFDTKEESERWCEKRVDEFWGQYLRPLSDVKEQELTHLNTPHGYGISEDFWRFDPKLLLETYRQRLTDEGQYLNIDLAFNSEQTLNDALADFGFKAKHVILAQGYQQTYWPGLIHGNPIQAKKGQYMIIECPGLKLSKVVKSKFFIIPMGQDYYQVGATYPRQDQPNDIKESQNKIVADLDGLLKLPYRIVDYWDGVRPTTKDRKPILGRMDPQSDVYVYNGLNSRGLLMAPLLASWLADFILDKKELPPEVSLNRFF